MVAAIVAPSIGAQVFGSRQRMSDRTSLPPGRKTRAASPRNVRLDRKWNIASTQNTRSKLSDAKGRAQASPSISDSVASLCATRTADFQLARIIPQSSQLHRREFAEGLQHSSEPATDIERVEAGRHFRQINHEIGETLLRRCKFMRFAGRRQRRRVFPIAEMNMSPAAAVQEIVNQKIEIDRWLRRQALSPNNKRDRRPWNWP